MAKKVIIQREMRMAKEPTAPTPVPMRQQHSRPSNAPPTELIVAGGIAIVIVMLILIAAIAS